MLEKFLQASSFCWQAGVEGHQERIFLCKYALSFSTKELWVFEVPSKVSFFDCEGGNEEKFSQLIV